MERQAAKELGIGYSTLQNWLSKHRLEAKRNGCPETQAVQESAKIQELKAEVHKLKLERDLLKRAAVFFATDRSS